MKDLYRILQVHPDADQETIQATYRSLLRRCHPDKNPGQKEWAERRTRDLNEAYAILMDGNKRVEYDRQRERAAVRRVQVTRPGVGNARVTHDERYGVVHSEMNRLEEELVRLRRENRQFRMQLEELAAQAGAREEQLQQLRQRLADSDALRRRLEQSLAVAEKQRDLLRDRLVGADEIDPQRSPRPSSRDVRHPRASSHSTPRRTKVVSLPGGQQTIAMVWVAGGTFRMGSDVGKPDERPVHEVTLSGFWMATTPVTSRQFASFLRAQPQWSKRVSGVARHADHLRDFQGDSPPPGRESCPVTWVSWHAAAAFCAWAGFTLPSEAQWEYAARGDEGYRYATSTGALMTSLANYGGKIGSITPVRRFPPNSRGLYDMSGNVWEWCSDEYDDAFYSKPDSTRPNPHGGPTIRFRMEDWEAVPGDSRRVIRGGSWQSLSADLRTSARAHQKASVPSAFCGFRCVLPE